MDHGPRLDSAVWWTSSAGRRPFSYGGSAQGAGFTLVEALAVVSIVAMLMVIGVPSFRDLLVNTRARAQVDDLATTMRLARAEALKRGVPITVCQSNTPEAAAPVCNNASNWMTGWVMFMDRGVVGTFNTGDVVIRVQQAYNQSGGITRAGSASLTFLPSGIAPGIDGSFLIRPNISTSDPKYASLSRRVCVNNAGATRLIIGATAC